MLVIPVTLVSELWLCSRSALNLIARYPSLLTKQTHLTSDYTSLEVRERKDEIWQTLYGKAAWQLSLQPLGWMVARKVHDSSVSPSVEACTDPEQAQFRKEKLLSWHNAVISDKILLNASRSTHDFHNFLGVKRELRMETRKGHENMKRERLYSFHIRIQTGLHSPLFWIVLERGRRGESESVVLEAAGPGWRDRTRGHKVISSHDLPSSFCW